MYNRSGFLLRALQRHGLYGSAYMQYTSCFGVIGGSNAFIKTKKSRYPINNTSLLQPVSACMGVWRMTRMQKLSHLSVLASNERWLLDKDVLLNKIHMFMSCSYTFVSPRMGWPRSGSASLLNYSNECRPVIRQQSNEAYSIFQWYTNRTAICPAPKSVARTSGMPVKLEPQ